IRLEKNFLDRDARQSLAFYVADIADVGADRIFAISADALFHFLRRQPSILPDHRDDGDVDVGENVFGCREDRGATKEQHHQCQDVKRVAEAKREADNAHHKLRGCSLMGLTYRLVQYISRGDHPGSLICEWT